jgi:ribosome-associated protein
MLEDRQAGDIVLLDVREITILADYFIISSGTSERQIRALLNAVSRQLKSEVGPPLGVEGEASGGWVLIDYGDVVVHIFAPETRRLYDLEGFWEDARTVVRIQ